MMRVQIVPGVTMRLDRDEIERLHLETLGALAMLDERNAQELHRLMLDEGRKPESHL